MRRKIVAGNWKMNTTPAEGAELTKAVAAGKKEICDCVNFIVCPPYTHLSEMVRITRGTGVAVGAQDCATEEKGAFTGEVSARMIASLGVEDIVINEGDAFDESVAEAIMNVPCGEGEQPNTINKVLKKGYRRDGKVIRFAQVVVTI